VVVAINYIGWADKTDGQHVGENHVGRRFELV